MAKVLIVDDSKFMRKILSDILIREGHELVGEAENAKEAIEVFKKQKPELVTLDIIMPDVEDLGSISALKAMVEENPLIKIVVVSAIGQQEVIKEYIQAGAKDFIVKPFEPTRISRTVKQVLGQ